MTREFKLSDLSFDHQQAIEAMKSQLLIAFINRLGGKVEMSVEEIDGTGAFVLAFKVDPQTRAFTFEVHRKDSIPHD